MRWNYILGSFCLLAIASYLDNVRGPLIPVLRRELGLSYGITSWFLVAGNLAAVLSTFAMIFLTRLFSDKRIVLGICGLGVLASLVAWRAGSLPLVIVLAILLGTVISASGAMSNVLLIRGSSPEERSRLFCGLHMVYGFASLVAPGIAGIFFHRGLPWAWTVALGTVGYLGLALFFLARFPRGGAVTAGASGRLRMTAGQKMVLVVFCLYVAAEVLTSMWMVTYLVEYRRVPMERATLYLSGFFAIMGLSRLICFVSLGARAERVALWGSVAAPLIFLLLGHAGWLWGFSLAGLLGPFFPLYLGRSTSRYVEEAAPLTLVMLTSVQVMQAGSHWVVGYVVDTVGVGSAYWIPWFLLALILVALPLYGFLEKRDPAV